MTSMTRGPLPPAVYWRRRLFVLGLAVALVAVIGGALRGGSDGSGDDSGGVAEQAAGTTSSTPEADPTRKARGKKNKKQSPPPTPTTTPLPVPTGSCLEDDILVQPVVDNAVAGRDVTIRLDLRTRTTAACTWQVDAQHVTLKITSGSDDIWASRHCPRAVPSQDVVVRQETTTSVNVVWRGARRSGPGCALAGWALQGYYHVIAAPLGGEPVDAQFQLVNPSPEIITQSPRPNQNQNQNKNKNKNNPDRNQGQEN